MALYKGITLGNATHQSKVFKGGLTMNILLKLY